MEERIAERLLGLEGEEGFSPDEERTLADSYAQGAGAGLVGWDRLDRLVDRGSRLASRESPLIDTIYDRRRRRHQG